LSKYCRNPQKQKKKSAENDAKICEINDEGYTTGRREEN